MDQRVIECADRVSATDWSGQRDGRAVSITGRYIGQSMVAFFGLRAGAAAVFASAPTVATIRRSQ
ncbi:MAG: hypothetical protein HC889_18005 [Synechococcaceae cyanobacterium SM1_2_3]|nr:hypothetical protein [Synechococcaceae cyanobacterium SM1_2_3]